MRWFPSLFLYREGNGEKDIDNILFYGQGFLGVDHLCHVMSFIGTYVSRLDEGDWSNSKSNVSPTTKYFVQQWSIMFWKCVKRSFNLIMSRMEFAHLLFFLGNHAKMRQDNGLKFLVIIC